MLKPVRIGKEILEKPLILAPMAGVTDLAYRVLCSEMGAGLVCMEMVSAKAIHYHNRNTETLMKIDPAERMVSLQLFGSEPEIMAEVAAQIQERPFTFLDINMGCPVPKVVNNGEGSALMRNPELAAQIVRSVVRAVHKPVTVKIRKGFDADHVNAVEMAKYLEDAGAAAIAIHGRTREQYYSGKADWEIIARVKEAVSIPVIGNGDIDSGEAAKKMLTETGCDGIMVGRAAEGNPWIFRQINAYLEEGRVIERPSPEELCKVAERHALLEIADKGEHIAMREMRKHMAWYMAGFPGAAKLRKEACMMETQEDMERVLAMIMERV